MKFLLFLLGSVLTATGYGQHVSHSLYLIGDAGLPMADQKKYHELVKDNFDSTISNTFLFLGDNIYPQGMPDKENIERAEAEDILLSELNLAKDLNASAYFIPGNHDWKRGRRRGLEYLKNQAHFIDSVADDRIQMLPTNGCPGPVEIKISNKLLLIIIDSQWFLQKRNKPYGASGKCDSKNESDFEVNFRKILNDHKEKTIVVAAHHPIFTYGEHGGVFPLQSHIFPLVDVHRLLYIPLPVVGSIYPLFRKLIGHRQDIQHRANRGYRKIIMRSLEKYPGAIYVSGHEHALQHMQKGQNHYVVSGASVKRTFIKKKGFAKYVSSKTGFARIDHDDQGNTSIVFFEADAEKETYRIKLDKK
jgi:DNA repair exonuclease SbcCD nuclease subunit